MATGARHAMYICEEREYGVLPENPVFMPLPHVTTDIGLKKDLMLHQEARADRQLAGLSLGANTVSGSITSEVRYGAFDIMLEGVMNGIWILGSLKPWFMRHSYSIIRHFEDLEQGKRLMLIKGVEFKGLKIKVSTKKLVSATFQVIGQSVELIEVFPKNSAFLDYPDNEHMDAFHGYVAEGGAATGLVSEIEFTLDKKLNTRFVIGSKNTILPGSHGSSCKGSMTAFFEDSEFLEKFINEEDSGLEIMFGSASESYSLEFPDVRYSGGKVDTSGAEDIPLNLDWETFFKHLSGFHFSVNRCDLYTTAIPFEFEEPVYVPDERGIIFEFDEPLNTGCR